MAFESLSEKLNAAFKKLRGKGKLSEQDIKDAMREVRIALLEADVNYKVAKDFIADVTVRCSGSEVMESLTPAQQVVKIVNERLTDLMGGEEAARIRILIVNSEDLAVIIVNSGTAAVIIDDKAIWIDMALITFTHAV